jgi:hypothetical protein
VFDADVADADVADAVVADTIVAASIAVMGIVIYHDTVHTRQVKCDVTRVAMWVEYKTQHCPPLYLVANIIIRIQRMFMSANM